jgi:hypothetical protein
MKNKLMFMTAMALAVAAIGLTGCKTPQLAAGGAYSPGEFVLTTNSTGAVSTNFVATSAPDVAFFVADQTYNAAYSIVDSAFKWEADNREQLYTLFPQIKKTLDGIRPTAWNIQRRWAFARKAYEDNPISANLTTIQAIVAEIQRLVPVVTAAEATVTTVAFTNSVPPTP